MIRISKPAVCSLRGPFSAKLTASNARNKKPMPVSVAPARGHPITAGWPRHPTMPGSAPVHRTDTQELGDPRLLEVPHSHALLA
jgi:hypothetical protein